MNETWDVGRILSATEDFFSKRGIESARLDAELLLADTLDISRESLLARREQRLTDIEISSYRERVRQRAGNKPVAYLLNRKEFFSLPFYVDESVLIPRPETEHLVEHVLNWLHLKSQIPNPCPPAGAAKSQIHICDVGAGSGCVAAALAHSRPDIFVTATEKSEKAARVAVKNVSDLGLLSRVRVVRCDLFPTDATEPFDAIVSNPPYLSLQEFESLPPGIRRFEPREALTDEADGLTFFRRILKTGRSHLKPDGVIFLEISPTLARHFSEDNLLKESAFSLVTIHPDLAGLPRVAEFRLG